MDSYLNIAELVLRSARHPLSPRGILASAYRSDLVPTHLHGKTQHKTLQARLSEDILERRENSLFFRTAPGTFFLREFLTDATIPEEFRTEVPTRRRVRELWRGPALALDEDSILKYFANRMVLPPNEIRTFLDKTMFLYDEPRRRSDKSVFIWSFVTVVKDSRILSYRLGRYREGRDTFLHKRTVGFSTLVHRDERNLFNMADHGIVDSGVKATMIDLDIPRTNSEDHGNSGDAELKFFLWIPSNSEASDLLAVVQFHCPEWFEPLQRRLAMNDLQWLDLANPSNNLDDFDPWSKCVLQVRNQVLNTV